MSKNKASKAKVQTTKGNHIVNTESEFAAEFGEGLYGAQARQAFKQHQLSKTNKSSK